MAKAIKLLNECLDYLNYPTAHLEDAVKELFWSNKLDIYTQSTESDFRTESIDFVEEE